MHGNLNMLRLRFHKCVYRPAYKKVRDPVLLGSRLAEVLTSDFPSLNQRSCVYPNNSLLRYERAENEKEQSQMMPIY